jgi:hypothetical protein
MNPSISEAASLRRRLWHPRGELCAVCCRPARGFGWFDPWRTSRPRPPAWFCSIACQRFWTERRRRSSTMVDLTEEERMAILATVKPVAEIMEEIGWETRLADLSEHQVLTLIEVAVGGFQEAMREIAASAPEAPL